MIDYPTMLLSGSLLVIAIVFLYLWVRAESKYRKYKESHN